MSPEFEAIVRHRLERAEAALSGARMFLESQDPLQSTNRLYYACFYAVIAWMQVARKDASKHTGVRAAVNKDLVATARLMPEDGVLYNLLFLRRQEADYMDFAVISNAAIEDWLPKVRSFIDRMKQIIEEDGGVSL